MSAIRRVLVPLVASIVLISACGDDDATPATAASTASDDVAAEGPTVVVTSSVLADVVHNLVGDQLEVVTIMPAGADPHDFQASAQQANQIREADVLIANGAGFEAGLVDVIESAQEDGIPTFEAISAVETVEFGQGGDTHDQEHSDVEHSDEHSEDHGHEHEGADPHFFLDPVRTAVAVEGIGDFLAESVEGIDTAALEASVQAYVDELDVLHEEVQGLVAGIDDDRRVLVTNHDAFGYFAERYGFEVIGTVIPSGSTADGASAGELAQLAEVVREEGVPAIFADDTASDDLAQTLAGEVGDDVAVVQLFTESLGEDGSEGETYVDMIRTNARRVADALA